MGLVIMDMRRLLKGMSISLIVEFYMIISIEIGCPVSEFPIYSLNSHERSGISICISSDAWHTIMIMLPTDTPSSNNKK